MAPRESAWRSLGPPWTREPWSSSRPEAVDRAELAALSASRSSAQIVDVTNEDTVEDFFAGVGPFDHLVYSAGDDLPLGPLSRLDLRQARARFETRYWGAVTAVKYGVPSIRPGRSIVLTSGFSATRPGWTSQASFQSAIEGLTRALAVELGPLRVNAVSPGVTRTPRWDAWTTADREAFYDGEHKRLPLKRVGDAEDLAGLSCQVRRLHLPDEELLCDRQRHRRRRRRFISLTGLR